MKSRSDGNSANPRLVSLALCLVLVSAGCGSLGPRMIAGDRFDYSASIGESWKRQMLLNIVKLRYLDPPIFVDVGQIVAGYTLESSINASAQIFADQPNTLDNNLTVGGRATYTDRPTITYTPLTGANYVKSLMTPLKPESVFFMIQSGWPADGVLFAAVASINGLKNQESTYSGTTPPDQDFMRALALMRKIQLAGGVSLRVQEDPQKQQSAILAIRGPDVSEETKADSAELRRLLKLDPNATEFKLVFAGTAANDKEVAVLTRSILHLLSTLAAQVEVPKKDLDEHRAAPGLESVTGETAVVRMIEIHSGKSKPGDAYVAVAYRDRWFWVDDRDLKSKRVFALMMLIFTLADTGGKEQLPLITIPAQ